LLQACEAETLLIAAFLGFGSLADTAALIAKVCFVLFPDLRHHVIPQKRLPAGITPVTVPIKTASKRSSARHAAHYDPAALLSSFLRAIISESLTL
jgi:Protein of unknown function (DUF1328)